MFNRLILAHRKIQGILKDSEKDKKQLNMTLTDVKTSRRSSLLSMKRERVGTPHGTPGPGPGQTTNCSTPKSSARIRKKLKPTTAEAAQVRPILID